MVGADKSSMTLEPDRPRMPWSWRDRLLGARLALAAAALVLFGLMLFTGLRFGPALVAFAVLAAASLFDISELTGRRPAVAPQEIAKPLVADWLIETVISGLPDPVIVLESSGNVVASNGPARALASALTRGAPLSFALRVPGILDAVRRAVTTGEAQQEEFVLRVPTDRWMDAVVVPIALAEGLAGRRDLVIVTLHDLTPLRRVEEMRADFVANASHELRTPLASLSGFIDTLQGPARDDAAARTRFLAIMKEQATRMARLIEDLLSLSRIELKAHVQPTQTADLATLVRHVADSLQPIARERGVEISLDLPDGPIMVRADRDELIRVFDNLVENALKYGASGKRIDIVLTREPTAGDRGEIVIAVRDYGPVIAPEHLPRLTERFYRVDVAESRAQGGTGLGLALVKHILNRHRGRLSIESVPGCGATFFVRLPVPPDAKRAEQKNSENTGT
jgi:two-component system, OmpR family, phosphate regulon sensor histidine kinase PhoR